MSGAVSTELSINVAYTVLYDENTVSSFAIRYAKGFTRTKSCINCWINQSYLEQGQQPSIDSVCMNTVDKRNAATHIFPFDINRSHVEHCTRINDTFLTLSFCHMSTADQSLDTFFSEPITLSRLTQNSAGGKGLNLNVPQL